MTAARSSVVLGVFALTALAVPPSARGQVAGRITSIAPACAPVGATVVITGIGFGAENVQVTVGGAAAAVTQSTGSEVTFVVPQVSPGVVMVVATNPGGQVGTIAFRVQGPEVCGNETDEDCDGVVQDPDVCTPVNHAPVAHAGSDQTAAVGTLVILDGTASSDADGDALTFQWTFVTRPAGSAVTLTDPTTATPSFTVDRPGSYEIQLVVSDGDLGSAPDTVVVSTINSAPVADAGPDQSGQVGNLIALDGSGSTDVDGDLLTYRWVFVSRPAASTATLDDPYAVVPTFTIDVFGEYVFELVVNDGAVDSQPDAVTVSTINTAPVADAGPDLTGAVGATVVLDGSASHDVDGHPLTYQWSLTTRPGGSSASVTDASQPIAQLTLDRPGIYVAQLLVNDGIVNSAPDAVTITTVNSKPVANAGPDQQATVGTVIILDATGSTDVDGDPLTYRWAFVSRPATSTATLVDATAVHPTFTVDRAGTYVVELIANDGTADSDPDTVVVTTINSRPVASAGPDRTGLVGQAVALDGTGSSDADGDVITYAWSLASVPDGSMAALSGSITATPTLVPDAAGTYVVQLVVNDGQLDSEVDTVAVHVPCGDGILDTDEQCDDGNVLGGDGCDPACLIERTPFDRPVASIVPSALTTLVGATVYLDGSASLDPASTSLVYDWTLRAKPIGSTASLQDATTATPSFLPDAVGTYEIDLIVTAAGVQSAAATTTVTVVPTSTVALTITSPSDAAALAPDRIRVQATFSAPANSGVAVNGIIASVFGSTFVAENVPLRSGRNLLTATLATSDGTTLSTTISVTSQALSMLLTLRPLVASAVAPVPARLEWAFRAATRVDNLQVDFTGDGTIDLTTFDPTTPLEFTYQTPGLYFPRLILEDENGDDYEATTLVAVFDAAQVDAILQNVWSSVHASLLAADIDGALGYVSPSRQARFGAVWRALLPNMSDIVASYSPLRPYAIRGSVADYFLTRTLNGELRMFFVTFARDDKGVWRLHAM